jgi:TolA-binding protein
MAARQAESQWMVIMWGMNRLWQLLLLMLVVGSAASGLAQDAPETAASPSQSEGAAVTPVQDNSALASEVEQLRSDVDQLKQQIATLNSVIEELQGARTTAEQPSAKRIPPAKTSVATKNAPSKKKTVASATPAPTPSIAAETDDRAPLTVLVFHDGHRVEARNYAIVGQTLWIYTEQDSKKVPLADLDVSATKDANADRGITFQLPPTR